MEMGKWMALLGVTVALGCALAPGVSFTEDRDTVLLARTIYAMARDESYDAKLAVGSVAMNRVGNPWFGDTLGEVLTQQHQFAAGSRYDQDSLAAAHEVLAGRRNLSADALYYHAVDAAEPWSQKPVKTVGRYSFYADDGSL